MVAVAHDTSVSEHDIDICMARTQLVLISWLVSGGPQRLCLSVVCVFSQVSLVLGDWRLSIGDAGRPPRPFVTGTHQSHSAEGMKL